jgi:hypothetical protein
MPHYIIMLLPLAAIFTSGYIRFILSYKRAIRIFLPTQMVLAVLVFIASILLNYYFFKPVNWWVAIAGSLLLIFFGLFLLKGVSNKAMKLVYITATLSLVFNFFLNYNFFPNLLKYQAGNELVKTMKARNIIIPDSSIIVMEHGAHSFDFYRAHNHRIIETTREVINEFPTIKEKYFLIGQWAKKEFEQKGLIIQPVLAHLDYNVNTVQLKFLNPATRIKNCDTTLLVKILR